MKFLSDLKDKDLSKEVVLLRVDLNVDPVRAEYSPRINDIPPTILFLAQRGARVIMLSHRGRPKGELNDKYTLKKYAEILSKKTGLDIMFIDHFNFKEIANTMRVSTPGHVVLMENMRFLKGEQEDDDRLAKHIASMGTMYVNDAFGVSHRANASVHAIAGYLPSYAGLLLETETKNLSQVMENPEPPLVVIIGGAKVSSKIAMIEKFYDAAEAFLVAGAMANTFLKSQGMDIGESIHEPDKLEIARELYDRGKIVLPSDSVWENGAIFDIGEKTREEFGKYISKAKTIVWNGPVGYIEDERFAEGTKHLIRAIADSSAYSVVGGGETVQVVEKMNMHKEFSFVSTGGGAMLDFLGGGDLPGLSILEE